MCKCYRVTRGSRIPIARSGRNLSCACESHWSLEENIFIKRTMMLRGNILVSKAGYFFVMLAVIVVIEDSIVSAESQAVYCQNEVYAPRCGKHEVLLMTSALYGRMGQTRCIQKDYGYVGCGESVMDVMDRFCSGRNNCSVSVPNTELDSKHVCQKDLKNYLEPVHTCVPVAEPPSCPGRPVIVLTSSKGFISNHVADAIRKCGEKVAQWKLQVSPEQRINLTLFDFFYYKDVQEKIKYGACRAYANIRDEHTGDIKTICRSDRRQTHVMTSSSNTLTVLISIGGTRPEKFLLKYEAFGCADLPAFSGGWTKRKGDQLTVGCENSDKTWTLSCKGNTWRGHYENCTSSNSVHKQIKPRNTAHQSRWFNQFSYVAVVIVLSIAIVVASLIFCVGVIYIKRHQASRDSLNPPENIYRPCTMRRATLDETALPADRQNNKTRWLYDSARLGENEYASIQDVRSPPAGRHLAPPRASDPTPSYSSLELAPDVDYRHAPVMTSSDLAMMPTLPYPGGSCRVPVGHQYFVVDRSRSDDDTT